MQAHADHLQEQSQQAQSEPVQVQAAVQAQSFQAKAQSLEKAAEAQSLQVLLPQMLRPPYLCKSAVHATGFYQYVTCTPKI